ncbi:MAG: peptidylprolyl isomerase [Planctomycetota bacterium]
MTPRTAVSVALLMLLCDGLWAGEFKVEFDLAETATVGEKVSLRVEVTNLGQATEVVKEPQFDYRSFDFLVSFDGGKDSRFTRYHPAAGSPSLLTGRDLLPGKSIQLAHEVIALKVGRWTFQPLFQGARGAAVEGPRKSVQVKPGKGNEMLLRFETKEGEIEAEFWPEVAPATSLHIAGLASAGFYDGLKFHRTIKEFMIQGGCPNGNGTGSPGYTVEAEFNSRKHTAGVLSMARSGDPYESMGKEPRPQFANSAGSQFFLCDAEAPFLDGKYTAFGAVVSGMDVVHRIAAAPATQGTDPGPSVPVDPVVMTSVKLVPRSP